MKMKKRMFEKFRKICLTMMVFVLSTSVALAAETGTSAGEVDPIKAVNNLSLLVTTLVSAVGGVVLMFSVLQLGIAIKQQNSASKAEALLGILGGLVIACAPWVVNYILK